MRSAKSALLHVILRMFKSAGNLDGQFAQAIAYAIGVTVLNYDYDGYRYIVGGASAKIMLIHSLTRELVLRYRCVKHLYT